MLVRTKHRLQQDGFQCTLVDLSVVGSEQITPMQWYRGVVSDLWLGLGLLETLNLKTCVGERDNLGLLQRLRWFIEELLLVQTIKDGEPSIMPLGTESVWIEKLVRTCIIDRWESQNEPEHLRTIRDRIERNGQYTGRMLGIG